MSVMSKTAELAIKYVEGWHLFATGAPAYPGRKDGRRPVLYVPRHRTDPKPFAAIGTDTRYSGRDIGALPPASVIQRGFAGIQYGGNGVPTMRGHLLVTDTLAACGARLHTRIDAHGKPARRRPMEFLCPDCLVLQLNADLELLASVGAS